MNDDFLNKCREIDFSAHSENRAKNLEILKTKLQGAKNKKISFKKPLVLIAAVVAMLSLSMIAFAAQSGWREGWRELEIRITVDGEYVESFRIISHYSTFYCLDEALGHLAIRDPLLPTVLPAGFEFYQAVFPICPIRNPGHVMCGISIIYSNGDERITLGIMRWSEGMEPAQPICPLLFPELPPEIVEILTRISFVRRVIDNAEYVFTSTYISYAELELIADSLQ